MKRITYTKAAIKTLRAMQPKRAAAIRDAIQAYAAGQTVDIKALQGSLAGAKRIRVGEFRVILQDDETTVTVTKIAARGSVY